MTHLATTLLAILGMTPREAAENFNPKLVPICHRESRCRALGIHARDAHLGRRAWENAVRVGILDPVNCAHHRRRENMAEWSTSGPFGMIRAYSMHYLPMPCVAPERLDLPFVAAFVAQRRYRAANRPGAPAALRRWARLVPLLSTQRRMAGLELAGEF